MIRPLQHTHARVKSMLLVGLLSCFPYAFAQGFSIPGNDASDGLLTPSENLEIDLSLAVTGSWDQAGTGNGVYDPNQWAVVFKYERVEIPEGVTVRFKNHPSRAPVIWLVSGDVTIAGKVYLDGAPWNKRENSEPGPGGFRGGMAWQNNVAPASGGYGPGGGGIKPSDACGNHATHGYGNKGSIYGNARLLPLIGGSGGGHGGGAGGGAIFIATPVTLRFDGLILVNGGRGNVYDHGSGAGGAVRLVANRLVGDGEIQAIGGHDGRTVGGKGRIRIEVHDIEGRIRTYPPVDISLPDDPVVLWPPPGSTAVRIISINNTKLTADPRASLELGQTDLTLKASPAARIVLETTNVSPEGKVQVRIVPKFGNPFWVDAAYQDGQTALSTWIAETNLPEGYFVIQALAENP